MTPSTARYVARVGVVILVLCALGSAIAQFTDEDLPPENSWGDNIAWMAMIPLFLLTVALEQWQTDFTLPGILLLYGGALVGLSVMVLGAVMGGVAAVVKERVPRLGRWVALVGSIIAVACAVSSLFIGALEPPWTIPYWNPQALWLAGGFVGLNVIVVGLVMAAAGRYTNQPGLPAQPMTPRQALVVALCGFGMPVLCVEVGVIIPGFVDDVFLLLPLCLGGFVGLVVTVTGLVMAAVGGFRDTWDVPTLDNVA